MPYQDFRQFLDALRAAGELVDIDRPVTLDGDVGKALKQISVRQGPALMFRQNGTAYPLVGGLYATRSKALLAFEATEATIFDKVLSGLDHPIAPVHVDGPAPCQEVVLTGADIDITKFPIPTYSPSDGGPFITAGIVVTTDPETGVTDIGHYRFQILGPDTMSFLAQPFHRFGKHIGKCRKLGIAPKAAILIGVDPILAYTCQVQSADTVNDWFVAGGLRGAPVELTRCRTIEESVPAHAEVVIEFEVDLATYVEEGPLGEYTGYYTPATPKPLARITAITHRKAPIFQGLLTGKPVTENHILKQIPFEASVLRMLKAQFPTVTSVCVPPSGGVSFYVVIAMAPRYAGEARAAMLAIMSSNIRPKWVVVVDPDINVFDSREVEWAMSFRVDPRRDVFTVADVPAGPLDPSVDESLPLNARTSGTVGIDATRPFGAEFAQVADVPDWEGFDLPELRAR